MNADLLTKNEAIEYLRNGILPENFTSRLDNLIGFYECANCQGAEDMNLVLRNFWLSSAPSWCPDCVETDKDGNKV